VTTWAHRELAVARIWLEIEPGNEPSLRVARRAGYRFEQRIAQHCRDWTCEDAERDSRHDCVIWVYPGDGGLTGRRSTPQADDLGGASDL
jgi:RimJ/RimL family protein N-acetyltransferase